MKSYSAKAVANYFLEKYRSSGITPLKMQKLVYIAHGWYLAVYDKPLIDDEYPEAWKYGPIFASIYHEFKYRGYLPILDPASEFEIDEDSPDLEIRTVVPKVEEDAHALLDRIWEVYGHMSGEDLSSLCHEEGSHWDKASSKSHGKRNVHIDEETIKKYYRERLQIEKPESKVKATA